MLKKILAYVFKPQSNTPSLSKLLNEAFENKDDLSSSYALWKLLELKLRELPKQSPEIKKVIDPILKGMGSLAEGKEWEFPVVYADAAASASNTAHSLAFTTYADDIAATYTTRGYATSAAAYAAYAANCYEGWVKGKKRIKYADNAYTKNPNSAKEHATNAALYAVYLVSEARKVK